jgi:hypothetical protein
VSTPAQYWLGGPRNHGNLNASQAIHHLHDRLPSPHRFNVSSNTNNKSSSHQNFNMRFTTTLLATVALSASSALAAPKENNALWSSECQALVGTCLQAIFKRTHRIYNEQEKSDCVCQAIKAHKEVSSCSRLFLVCRDGKWGLMWLSAMRG